MNLKISKFLFSITHLYCNRQGKNTETHFTSPGLSCTWPHLKNSK
jgi:hypothetical protein